MSSNLNPLATPAAYLTIKQAAHVLQLSPSAIYRHVKLGTLPAVQIGGAIRIKVEDLPQSSSVPRRGTRKERANVRSNARSNVKT